MTDASAQLRFVWNDDDVVIEGITLKHLPGRHDQRSHGYRYGARATMSHLRRQRSTMTVEQWEDYKARARARQAQLVGKPVTEAMLKKSPYGGWGEYRENDSDHFLLMITQSPDMHKHSIRPDQFNPERERELVLDTLNETRRVLNEYPDLVRQMDEQGYSMLLDKDRKMGMNIVFTVDDEYSGAGSGGPGGAKVFWTPYTAQGVDRYQNRNFGPSFEIDPMYVLAHELHHGFGSNTEIDNYSRAVGMHMHLKHGNQLIPKQIKWEVENTAIHAQWRAQGKFKQTVLEERAALKFLHIEHPEQIDAILDDYYGLERADAIRKRIKSW